MRESRRADRSVQFAANRVPREKWMAVRCSQRARASDFAGAIGRFPELHVEFLNDTTASAFPWHGQENEKGHPGGCPSMFLGCFAGKVAGPWAHGSMLASRKWRSYRANPKSIN
jgi:hypothetical protein